MESAARSRLVLFGVVSVAMLAAAVVFRGVADPPPAPEADGDRAVGVYSSIAPSTRAVLARVGERRREVESAARGFLRAFLRYEVGEAGVTVRRALRSTATTRFYDRLLRYPPRRATAGGYPPRATLAHIDVAFVSPSASLAVVSGTARRRAAPEEFSFVFRRTPGGWLAVGPGE